MRRPPLITFTCFVAFGIGACALIVDTTGLVATGDGATGLDSASETTISDALALTDAAGHDDGDAGLESFASCDGASGAGISLCGPDAGESCCDSPLVPGGTFRRSFDGTVNSDGLYPATVSGFRLDRFEVTVARFRRFVAASVAGWKPAGASGKHAHVASQQGLVQAGSALREGGWDSAWTANLATTHAEWSTRLACNTKSTWTDQPGGSEALPINCVTWFDAYAFCIWDGGFLPSETEWNFAATGGDEQRLYPWSVSPGNDTTLDCTHANYGGDGGDGSAPCYGMPTRPGTFPKGDGRWRHADLSGNVLEWTLDGYAGYANPCLDCVNLLTSTKTVLRGGTWYYVTIPPYSNSRFADPASLRADGFGLRCARAP